MPWIVQSGFEFELVAVLIELIQSIEYQTIESDSETRPSRLVNQRP